MSAADRAQDEADQVRPKHIAVVMDGNGRWAQRRGSARSAGHRAGVKAARQIVESCVSQKIEILTLFAFSSENWQRPKTEVRLLMQLFAEVMQREVKDLHKNNVQIKFVGDLATLAPTLQKKIRQSEELTDANSGLKLRVAVSYGGRWDIVQAAQKLAADALAGQFAADDIDEHLFSSRLATAGAPDPDLFIRTGGERRISNFLLWNLAYSEMYFSDTLWPDFDETSLLEALQFFASRERRFGQTVRQTT